MGISIFLLEIEVGDVDEKLVLYFDVFVLFFGYDVFDGDEFSIEGDLVFDEDYVIGGMGVVKVFICCL